MVSFKNACIPVSTEQFLHVDKWTITLGEFWIISGEDTAAKTALAHSIAGIPGSRGGMRRLTGVQRSPVAMDCSWISFDSAQKIRSRIRRDDDSEYLGYPDEGITLEDFIGENGWHYLHPDLAAKLKGRGVRHLSTGEFRQVLIAREAAQNRKLVVLDEPFEGLDADARMRLHTQLEQWADPGKMLVITAKHREDIPAAATGMVLLKDDHLQVHPYLKRTPESSPSRKIVANEVFDQPSGILSIPVIKKPELPEEIIGVENLHLSYKRKSILEGINWRVHRGEAWLLSGPNGSGKSSLLNMICGDEPRAFGQNIRVFGIQRVAGTSIAETASRIGMVSDVIEDRMARSSTLTEILGSGLRNSMILQPELNGFEKSLVERWLELSGLRERGLPCQRLSCAERRMGLLARAMISNPALLLLDEPMQGLGAESRRRACTLIELFIRQTGAAAIYITHRPEEVPDIFNRHIALVPGRDGGPSRGEINLR